MRYKHKGQEGMRELGEKETRRVENCELKKSREALKTILNHRKNTPLVMSDEEMASPENGSDTIEGQGGAGFPAKRFITGTAGAIAERKKQP